MTYTADDYEEHIDCMSEVFYEDYEMGIQLRLTVSEFRGRYYFGMRKWYVDINDEWLPTKQGFSIPYNLKTTSSLFGVLTKLLSRAEVLHEVVAGLAYLEKEIKDENDSKTHVKHSES